LALEVLEGAVLQTGLEHLVQILFLYLLLLVVVAAAGLIMAIVMGAVNRLQQVVLEAVLGPAKPLGFLD
jgi:hypothetical protein